MQKSRSLCTRELGNRFYLLRGTKTQKDMAAALGISQAHYCRMEMGEFEPSLTQLIRICDLLDIHPGDLLKMKGVITDRE